jgi:serine protease
MKKILPLLFLLSGIAINAQKVFTDYQDGVIYVKLSKEAGRSLLKLPPRNISPGSVTQLKGATEKFRITRVTRPFFTATDDEFIPYILKVEFAQANKVQDLLASLEGVKGIEYAEKIPYCRTTATPNDFSISTASIHLAQINAQGAWNYFNGNSNIPVAIVDNAVMWSHADLVANTYTNTGETPNNGIDDDGNGYIDDVNGFNVSDWDNDANPTQTGMAHGTHCAGIAGARTDNSIGVASIGWNIKIIPVQCEADNSMSMTTVSNGYDGIVYASRARARVISCSWGSSSPSVSEQAVVNYAWNRGSIIIAAAGNLSSTTAPYPAGYNNVYGVAAVDQSDVKVGFSNYGPWVDISAPGWNIYSTLPYVGTPSYGNSSGTSMAAPMVAGLAGLMLSKSPSMTKLDVLNCISSTAANIYSLSGNAVYTGSLGAGRIDAAAAMACAASFSLLPPAAEFSALLRNTCPNTPVKFTDSSLYLPTAWSWTFQGGSPATSTLQNPVVQWSSSGTYSVALQASNSNGSNTKTKLSYITVAGPISPPFFEGFQQNTFLPSGWTAKNIMNDNMYWERVTGVGGFGTSTACVRFDNYNNSVEGERDEMLSPKFTFTNVAIARLRFDVAYRRYDADFSDSLQVKLSTDCGTTWTSIYLKGGTPLATGSDLQTYSFVPTSTEWRTDSIDISSLAAGQNNVMFSFINRGHYGQVIYLDNINLFFPTPTLTVTHPTAVCSGANLTLSNSSAGAATYTWSFPGGTPASSTASAPAVSFASSGTKTITLNATNGTSTVSITRTVNVVAMPVTAVNSPSVCSGNSVVLQASGANTYSWNNTATTSSISVAPNSTNQYTVTGTNSNLCSVSATATVSVVATPTLSVPGQTVCPGGTATLTASGASGYLWTTSATSSSIIVTPTATTIYTVLGNNGPCVSTETVTLTLGPPLPVQIISTSNSVCIAQSVTLTATGANNYVWNNSISGSIITAQPTLTSVYTVTGSVGSCTGMATATITVDQTPTLAITSSPANGPFCSNQLLILQASGAQNFQWANGPAGAVYIITPTQQGPLTLTVTGSNGGCSLSTSITLSIGPDTLQINITPTVVSACAGQQVTLTASGMNTYTWSGNSSANPHIFTAISSGTVAVHGTAGNCPGSGAVAVTVNAPPSSNLSSSATCAGSCNGVINAQTSGGSGPYSFLVTPGNCNSLPCTQLCAGQYTITTMDANQCSSTNVAIVGASAPITVTNSTAPNSCGSCNNGSATVVAGGGQPPYNYAWSNGSTGPVLIGAAPGCYSVTVTDATSCSTMTQICITDVTAVNEAGADAFVMYPNPARTTVEATLPTGDFEVEIYNSLAQMVYRSGSVSGHLTIPVETYARGAYLVIFKAREGNFHKKLLLE